MSALADKLAEASKTTKPEAEDETDDLDMDAIDECCAAMMPDMDPAESRSMFKAAVMQAMKAK